MKRYTLEANINPLSMKRTFILRESDTHNTVVTFKVFEDLVDYCKKELIKSYKDFEIEDLQTDGEITFKDGVVDSVWSYMGFNDEVLEKDWGIVGTDVNSDEYEIKCTFCGDGGCIYCEPSRFI